MNDDERVTYFGETDARNKRVRFGIKKKDRSRHMYVIGKTAMGKSTLLENLAIQDIQNGEGLAFIDPHGKTADLLLEYVPEHRIKDVIYFAPFDLDYPISFNVLEDVGAERRHLVANGLMTAFKKIWVDAWSARMEYILTNIILALLEYPGSTLMGVNRMLVDKDFRNTIVSNISDPSVKAFWTEEYAKYTDKFAAEAAPAIQNKVGQFVANPLVRNIIGQSQSSFDIRKVMDERKILIINLSKGRVGEANANLLGAMIITKIYLAAMSRADLNEQEMKAAAQFYLYVDEFQSFANESFADILSEARKYKLCLIIAHQYIEQMTDEVRAAVFGNVGTMVTYRVGSYDGAVFEKEFAPQFTAEDMVNLQQYQMYLKLMIDQVTSVPFSAMGMPPIPRPPQTFVQEIIAASRAQYANPRDQVEDTIRNWHIDKIQPIGPDGKPIPPPPPGSTPGAFGNSMRAQQDGPRDSRSSGGQNGANNYNSAPGRDNRGDGRNDRGDRPSYSNDNRGTDRNNSNQGQGVQGAMGQNRGAPSRPATSDRLDRTDRPISRGPRDSALSPQQRGIQDRYNREREQSLRDAVSLNYLKDKKEEEQKAKNEAKTAKPENLLALKEALLGILNEGVGETLSVTPEASVTQAAQQVSVQTTMPAPSQEPALAQVLPPVPVPIPVPTPVPISVTTSAPTPTPVPTPVMQSAPIEQQVSQRAPQQVLEQAPKGIDQLPQAPISEVSDDGFVDLKSLRDFTPKSQAEPQSFTQPQSSFVPRHMPTQRMNSDTATPRHPQRHDHLPQRPDRGPERDRGSHAHQPVQQPQITHGQRSPGSSTVQQQGQNERPRHTHSTHGHTPMSAPNTAHGHAHSSVSNGGQGQGNRHAHAPHIANENLAQPAPSVNHGEVDSATLQKILGN